MRGFSLVISAAMLFSTLGCSGHFVVKPTTPTAPEQGFRYYLPKPYLVVTNMTIAVDAAAAPAKADAAATPNAGKPKPKLDADPLLAAATNAVTVKIIYLPDTAHPYAVTVAGAGIGTFKGGLQLTNGWMLTNVSEESDAKVAETITAVSGLITSALSAAKVAGLTGTEPTQIKPYFYLFEIDPSNHTLTKVNTTDLENVLNTLRQ